MIRIANKNDMPIILNIYEYARNFMKNNGNETQWNNNYPPKDLLYEDIQKEQLYVYEEDNIIHGVFAFIIGEDEKNTNILTIKNNNTKEEYKINRNEIVSFIKEN